MWFLLKKGGGQLMSTDHFEALTSCPASAPPNLMVAALSIPLNAPLGWGFVVSKLGCGLLVSKHGKTVRCTVKMMGQNRDNCDSCLKSACGSNNIEITGAENGSTKTSPEGSGNTSGLCGKNERKDVLLYGQDKCTWFQ